MKGRSAVDEPAAAAERNRGDDVAIVKKYANRRLYNTATSSYVTLEELARMTREGKDFVVYDAKTGEDITRSILTQIILEEDSKGRNLLPIGFLRQLISFYDDSLRSLLPRYLEISMENFARNQDQMRAYLERTFGQFFPLRQFEDLTRQNVALFQRAARMFSPFGDVDRSDSEVGEEGRQENGNARTEKPELSEELRALREQMAALQRQIDALTRNQEAAAKETRGTPPSS